MKAIRHAHQRAGIVLPQKESSIVEQTLRFRVGSEQNLKAAVQQEPLDLVSPDAATR